MKNKILVVFLVLGLAFSCSDRDDNVTNTNVRIQNVSSLLFDTLSIGVMEMPYESIASEEFSEYMEFETVSSEAVIEITSGEETFVYNVDISEEDTSLRIGFYTYEIDITEEGEVSVIIKLE